MFVSGLEVTVFAYDTDISHDVSLENIDPEQKRPNIEEELISERTAYSKVFLTDDGGFYTIVSAVPIHIEDENGTFQNIEEPTVELSTEEVISQYITTEAQLLNSSTNIATYASNITTTDSYEDDTELLVKCFSSTGVYTDGNSVQGASKGNKTTYIKPIINQSNILVTSAKINANALGLGNTANNYVVAKKTTTSWDENTTTKPSTHNNYFDCVSVSKSTMTTSVEWDITHLMNLWVLGMEENNGFALVAKKKGCDVSLSEITMSFYYHNIDELDDNFTYETVDMGTAGTIYINHFSCIPILQHNDIGIDGEKAPVYVSHIYNPLRENTTVAYGNNMRINYTSLLKYIGNLTYSWNTPDGETINFIYSTSTNDTKTFISINSETEFTLELQKDNSENQFNYTSYENITIHGDSNKKFAFESHSNIGYLISIDDGSENQNKVKIDYSFIDEESGDTYLSNNIIQIEDGANRKYKFNYTIEGTSSYLESINVTTANDTDILIGTEEYKVEYNYQSINGTHYLTGINHVGDISDVTYSYDSNNRLSTISSGSKTLTLHYSSNSSNKISYYEIHKTYNGSSVLLERIEIDSTNVYERVFTNLNGEKCIINYDENYNIVCYQDYDGTIINGINQNGITNYLLNTNNVNNLVLNGNFKEINEEQLPENWVVENEGNGIYLDDELDEDNEEQPNTLQINAILSDTARIYQQIDAPDGISFKEGESYAYGGTAKADNAIASNDKHTFGIYVFDAVLEDGILVPNQCVSYFNFDHTLHNIIQQKMSYFTLEEETPALFIYICFDYNFDGESAFFDNIQLYEYEISSDADYTDPYTYEYNRNNSIISEKLESEDSNNSNYMELSYKYDDSCDSNYLSEMEDERGITTYYTYNPDNGRLVSIATGAEENAKSFEYTASGLLSSVKQIVTNTITGNSVEMKTNYAYTDSMLSSVTHNGFSYNFTYDVYGNVTDISISTQETSLVSTTYVNAQKSQIDTITYANGDTIVYYYNVDNPNLITRIDSNQYIENAEDNNMSKSLLFTYDESGNLSSVLDEKAKVKITYNNDSFCYILLDDSEHEKILYQSNVDNEGNTVENFIQANDCMATLITTDSIVSEENTITTTSSSQTLTRTGTLNDKTEEVEFTYEKVGKTDEFGRLLSNDILSKHQTNSSNTVTNLEDAYTYKSINNKQTTLIDSYRTSKSSVSVDNEENIPRDSNGNIIDEAFIDLTYSYTYDSAGNITQILLTDNITNATTSYGIFKYDNANQLIMEYSVSSGCCICYTYDAGGNITEKRVYDLSAYDSANNTVDQNAPYESYIFTYDEHHKDKLISVTNSNNNNVSIINYDALGNPLNYDAANGFFEWNGNLLVAFETNGEGNRYEYEYDENGFRTRKIVYDKNFDEAADKYVYELEKTLEYVWNNGELKGVSISVPDQNQNSFMNIIYDESGIAQGYIGISGTPYYYVRDALGNVTSIISGIDDVCIDVSYDAWGNPVFPPSTDDIGLAILTAFICYYNPSTYKGYLYDYETGLYYCQSRYYSPVWSRFINMDDANILKLTQGETLSANLYAYCNNNPVNYTDPTGYWPKAYSGFAETYSGFKWTSKGFNLNVHRDFLSKSFCLSYASDILKIKKTKTYKNMSQQRIAVELYFHAVAYYGTDLLRSMGINTKKIKEWNKAAKYMEINNDDSRSFYFYLLWNTTLVLESRM